MFNLHHYYNKTLLYCQDPPQYLVVIPKDTSGYWHARFQRAGLANKAPFDQSTCRCYDTGEDNTAAQKAYAAPGFRRAGDDCIVLLGRQPVSGARFASE